MVSQRLASFRRGAHLNFVRSCPPLFGPAYHVWWHDDLPCALGRGRFDAAALIRGDRRILGDCRGPRVMAMAAPRAADGLVVVHEHPRGARMFTTRGADPIGETIYPEEHFDLPLATDGRRIVTTTRRGQQLRWFTDWTLRAQLPVSLPAPKNSRVLTLEPLADALLMTTTDRWSRWSWDGQISTSWPTPPDRSWWPVTWSEPAPILLMQSLDDEGRPRHGHDSLEVVAWDLATGARRSFGLAREWPKAAVSPDGRWLALARVTREGRGLELWDLPAMQLVERIRAQRRAVHSLAFAPDSRHLALATKQDLFVLRIDP